MNILLKYKDHQTRSGYVGRAWLRHITEETDDVVVVNECEADLAILYGMGPSNLVIYKQFRAQNKPTVTIDLGYWQRGGPHNQNAYYKVAVNHWHPNAYIMKINATPERFNQYALHIRPWQHHNEHQRHYILLAGMGPKSCDLYHTRYQQWDRWVVEEIQKHTDRKIIYRPKPSDLIAKPIEGTHFSNRAQSITTVINSSWCIVTYHSNVSVDALLCGIPAICCEGAANSILNADIANIEKPNYIKNREQFFWNLAWCQWSLQEMASGECWKYIKETVLPLVGDTNAGRSRSLEGC